MERCRNCGKEIVSFGNFRVQWTHNRDGIYLKYCYRLTFAKTDQINLKAEPFTKNEIVYGILKDL